MQRHFQICPREHLGKNWLFSELTSWYNSKMIHTADWKFFIKRFYIRRCWLAMMKTTCRSLPTPAKLKVMGKASPVSGRNYPREYSRAAYCVRCWISTIKYFLWIRKPRHLNLRKCPLPRRMSWWSLWWLSQDASPIYGKLQKGFVCIVRRSGHLLGLVEKPFPL